MTRAIIREFFTFAAHVPFGLFIGLVIGLAIRWAI